MKPTISKTLFDGTQNIYHFDNGYGGSVVRHRYSYGGLDGLWELAVIRLLDNGKWEFDYCTHITDDVIGNLTWPEVVDILKEISTLESDGSPHFEDDYQPSEYDEWMSYDPDC